MVNFLINIYIIQKNSKYTDNKLYPVLIKIKPSIH